MTLAVPYSQIPKRQVHWFWEGYIPFRHVTMVIAARGTAKGITTIDLGARMTRHDPAPGEAEPNYDGPRDVVIIAGEDDQNESVAGRLDGAGAVLDRVHDLTYFPGGQKFSVPADIPSIKQAILDIEYEKDPLTGQHDMAKPRYAADGCVHKVGMVILDPLLSLAVDELTRRKPAREVIEGLEQVAKDCHLAILLTHHTNANGKAAGSRALVETVRNELTLSWPPKAPADSPVRLVTVTKTNIGRLGLTQRYVLTGTIETPTVVWESEVPAEQEAGRGYEVSSVDISSLSTSPGLAPGVPPGPAAASSGVHDDDTIPIPVYPVIPAVERFRASYLVSTNGTSRKPHVIGDYDSSDAARQACEQAACQQLAFSSTPTPGMEGAVVRNGSAVTYYGVLDRYAAGQQAAA